MVVLVSTYTSTSDRNLAVKAAQGDQDAFEQIVLANQNKVYSLCLRLVNNRDDAADLAQEVFLKAWRSLPNFRGNSSLSTWLYRMATNLCIDHLRYCRTRQGLRGPSLDDEESTIPEPGDWSLDPHHKLEKTEISRAIERGLSALPEHYRQIITLREIAGLDYQELAAALDIDLGTVKSRLSRARLALRKILLADSNFSDQILSNYGKGKE